MTARSHPETVAPAPLDVERVRSVFPILRREVHGKALVYLDSAATNQKPQAVLDAIRDYYENHNANVHRGVHKLSQEATDAFEGAREKFRAFVNAREAAELVFVRGTTEAINLVGQAWGRPRLTAGDEILITHMEHHSNIVPWQMLCEQTGAVLRVAPIRDCGELDLDAFDSLLGARTRIVSVIHASNALGTINPVRRIAESARRVGAVSVVDGAQALAHVPVDVQALGCDFYASSGHKMFGPTGIGVLYGRRERFEEMTPYQGGGDMIRSVSFEGTTYNDLPYRFEAGTPNIAGAVGLAAAVDFIRGLGVESIGAWEHELLEYGTAALQEIPGLRLIGTAPEKSGVLSFVMDRIHPHDIGTIVDHEGVAIRTGHHCAQPVMERYGIPATARASLSVFNTRADLDALVRALTKVRTLFG